MKLYFIIGTIAILLCAGFSTYNEIKYPSKELEHPMSTSMQNIQEKCGVLGTDLLWTTAMDKISDCINNIEVKGYGEGIKAYNFYYPASDAEIMRNIGAYLSGYPFVNEKLQSYCDEAKEAK